MLGFKNAGVDGVIAANFPNPTGVLINQARQNGLTVPIIGNTSINLAKESTSLQSTSDLYVVDDCTPDLRKDPVAKKTLPLMGPVVTQLFIGLQGAGPNLSAETYAGALFRYPPSGGGPQKARK